jgi:hypothetical protein
MIYVFFSRSANIVLPQEEQEEKDVQTLFIPLA